MIQVLGRAFKLLEQIAEDPFRVWSISELAEIIGTSSATCFHIVTTLNKLGYLESLGKRKGYRFGPAINKLCHNSVYRPDLIESVQELMKGFTIEVSEAAVLSVLHGDKRYILCETNAEKPYIMDYHVKTIPDIYYTATGRLLLAYLSEAEIRAFIKEQGLPKAVAWPEATTSERFFQELADIRAKERVVLENNQYIVQVAFPIFEATNKVASAIGSFIPKYRFEGEHREVVLNKLMNLVKEASHALLSKQR